MPPNCEPRLPHNNQPRLACSSPLSLSLNQPCLSLYTGEETTDRHHPSLPLFIFATTFVPPTDLIQSISGTLLCGCYLVPFPMSSNFYPLHLHNRTRTTKPIMKHPHHETSTEKTGLKIGNPPISCSQEVHVCLFFQPDT